MRFSHRSIRDTSPARPHPEENLTFTRSYPVYCVQKFVRLRESAFECLVLAQPRPLSQTRFSFEELSYCFKPRRSFPGLRRAPVCDHQVHSARVYTTGSSPSSPKQGSHDEGSVSLFLKKGRTETVNYSKFPHALLAFEAETQREPPSFHTQCFCGNKLSPCLL